MSYKTERLVNLFPEPYSDAFYRSAGDKTTLLYKLLDAVGAELMEADEAIKNLLKSHWVETASNQGLDGLGAIFGVERRRLPDSSMESDAAFRLRLKSIVKLFTGGGTRRAIEGAVRSALGLPFDLDRSNLPDDLRQELQKLVTLEEFSPQMEQALGEVTGQDQLGELVLSVAAPSIQTASPLIEWTFKDGNGIGLRLECIETTQGLMTELFVPQGKTLEISSDPQGRLQAFLARQDVSASFRNLDGSAPTLPAVPRAPSHWKFNAGHIGSFDSSYYDGSYFDPPLFQVKMSWRVELPLTFDVTVPYHLQDAVEAIKDRNQYSGEIFVYKGLGHAIIQQVVDQTRAAGVRGSVRFSLNFLEEQAQDEGFHIAGAYRLQEEAGAKEKFTSRNDAQLQESLDAYEKLMLGGVFNIARFDNDFAFT